MRSVPTDLEQNKQQSGVIILFENAQSKKQPKPCIFCGETVHLQTFKGKAVCSACLERIPSLFACSY
ncbi:hypothetical protein [Desulfitobacterium sp. Sab5]|uniref:hypothetical protein n=1 Tax=Desulfitobacterium TaxID=36853 RepID=UPI003CF6E8B2